MTWVVFLIFFASESLLMRSQKLVILAKAGIQGLEKPLKFLDSRFHGNDVNPYF